ncbi:thiosulfate oxidation carrier complex protein SoxZ [Ponticoccus sp. SC2-23]|uniref:thiosulfate oxidation carrier complex protein SoxZ n=1 Tax=Alexandriicola marinus TaxID=2081710 RepID=UPI000FD8FC48|nr:thiosulfate oxidation carrier complex protein SoxZ [Alexandriicola marinus]MBM1221006.1 thiosulfate oxidation carrier complex protein SoxZ [Ponticoccus sp. SC6-9]MBM1225576.1 thiosulfate oxidation carrier complex protein SoxZ [Ponticoccus sp. SC6-15]MBM1227728.1 thiosulfate oxidation carrier complex protein SoxZ [Ponticoccus sp. SC6-38]MBM1234634.1 thiosulfate oxidation carrier complex protein SoxZ [Ponticoccus sp. SC6-45]MBM1238230.1 thiosulfate oxidation carrier complex protein SoxZ [Pont
MTALINVPETAAQGEIIEIKVLLQHPMETGFRTGPDGKLVPRNIIHSLRCLYLGEEVFAAELFPAVTANPFFAFTLVADVTGEVEFLWVDEDGEEHRESRLLSVA